MLRIMVIDDEREYVQALISYARLLHKDVGIIPIYASSQVMSALWHYHLYLDFILLNITMPGSDGFEILEQILEYYPSIPVGINTACLSYLDRLDCNYADGLIADKADIPRIFFQIPGIIERRNSENELFRSLQKPELFLNGSRPYNKKGGK